jgi:formate dehydrogenase major subunit
MCAEQTHRALSILQLVLGNIGCSGGGIYHTEAFGNSLGVDYQIPSWNMLPGMIPLPGKGRSGEDSDLALYMRNRTPSSNNPSSVNFWQNLKGYAVSLLRAWYGERGTESSRYNFDWIPKGNSDLTSDEWLSKFGSQYKGAVLLGADLSAYGIPSDIVRRALSSLSWLAVSDIWHTDSSDFWKNIKCDTEVFLFPSVTLFEKDGTMVTSSRWVEKRELVSPLSKKCGSEFTLINDLFSAVKKGCSPASSLPEQITFAAWKYNSPDDVLREMSGYTMKSGKKGIADISMIKDDGSTACGNILFCGAYPGEPTANTDDATGKTDAKLYPSWGYSIPGNVRVLYNGAGVEKSGYPSDPKRRVISFAEDFSGSDEPHGIENPSMNPFVMNREGTASIFSSTSVYGPLPDQYNTGWGMSSLPKNPLNRMKQNSGGSARAVVIGEKRYCLEKITQEAVFSLAGVCEMHPSFAAGKKISTGDTVKVSASGKSVQARALVTERVRSSSDKGSVVNMVVLRGGAFREIISDPHSGIVSVDVTKISGGAGK